MKNKTRQAIEAIQSLPGDNRPVVSPLIVTGSFLKPFGYLLSVTCVAFLFSWGSFGFPKGQTVSDKILFVLLFVAWFLWIWLHLRMVKKFSELNRPVTELLSSGFLLEERFHGFQVHDPSVWVVLDHHKGIIIINRTVDHPQAKNHRTLVIEFEKIKMISIDNNRIQLILKSIEIQNYLISTTKKHYDEAYKLSVVFGNNNELKLRHARGDDYPELREVMRKKGWLLE